MGSFSVNATTSFTGFIPVWSVSWKRNSVAL